MAQITDVQRTFGELRSLCRICAKKPKNGMKNLFTTYVNETSLAEQLETCLRRGISNNDGLPSNICSGCSSTLNKAYEFHIKCSASENKFLQLLAKQSLSQMKHEVNDEASYDAMDDTNENIPTNAAFEQNKIEASPNQTDQEDFTCYTILPEDEKTQIECVKFEETTLQKQCIEQIDAKSTITYEQDANSPTLCHQINQNSIIRGRDANDATNMSVVIEKVKSTKNFKPNHPYMNRGKFFECYRCKSGGFKGRTLLRDHVRSCGRAHIKALYNHKIKTKHVIEKEKNENENIHQCEYCSKRYKLIKPLVRHIKSHENVKEYECDKCPNKYVLKLQLDVHMLFHAGVKRYVCGICNKGFMKPEHLTAHKHIHNTETPFLCSECGKAFKSNSNLRQHVKHHKGDLFACSDCPARFATNGNLKRHRYMHSSERKYPCDECGARFAYTHLLTTHIRTHTNDRRWPCTMCEKRFYSSNHLKTHIRTHTGEKPHKCEFCDRAYAQKGDLTKHRRTHIGTNTYKCKFCTKKFRFRVDLRNHLLDHYKKQKSKVDVDADDAELKLLKDMEEEWKKQVI